MKARVNPQDSRAEVLSIRRTRREEILLVLKKGGDVSAFGKALDLAVGDKADARTLVSKRTLEVRGFDETVTREEDVAALCIALGKPDLRNQCKLYKRFTIIFSRRSKSIFIQIFIISMNTVCHMSMNTKQAFLYLCATS